MYDPLQNPKIDYAYLGDTDMSILMDDAVRDARTAERDREERKWNINLCWYLSEPWWRLGYNNEIDFIKPELRDQYFHINIITPRVQALIGNELYIPKFEARPKASPQLEDVFRARAAADVANHCVVVSDAGSAIRDSHLFKHLFGLCWYEVGWDDEGGPLGLSYNAQVCPSCGGLGAIQDQMTPGGIAPCPQCGAEGAIPGRPDLQQLPPGQIYVAGDEEPQGEVCVRVCAPWEVYFDPNAYDPFKTRWLVHDVDMDRTVAFNRFCKDSGITADELEESSPADALDRSMVSRLPSANKMSTGRKNMVRVRRYYSLRTTKHPRGLYGVKVGGKLIEAGPLPYAHRKIPFVPLRCHVAPMRMYPKSTVDNLMPSAIFVNEMMTARYQRAKQSVQMRLLAARGSAIDMSDIQGILEYDPKRGVEAPKFFNDNGASPDAEKMVEILTENADRESFSGDVLRGEANSSQDNARFSAFREQRAINPLKMMIDDNSRSFSLLGKLLVETAKLFYGPGRVIRSVFGSHGHAKMFAFGTTPIGSSDDFEIMPVRDIGRSLASRREELYEAKKSGILDDPKLMRLAEFATEDGMLDEVQIQQTSAMLEGERLRAGMPMGMATEYEDHEVHIDSHVMLLAEFKNTFGPQDPRMVELMTHIKQHKQWQAAEQVEQQQLMAMAAQQYGMANAADPSAQPTQTQQQVQNTPQATATNPIQQGEPGPPESQPALQQVDQQQGV